MDKATELRAALDAVYPTRDEELTVVKQVLREVVDLLLQKPAPAPAQRNRATRSDDKGDE